GPAAPEIGALPVSLGAAALISAPIRARGERIGTLLLADTRPRPDLSDLDAVALDTVCRLIADAITGPPLEETTGIRRSDPPRADSLPPDTAELAAWPLDPLRHDP